MSADEEYYSPRFLDCCGLVRRVMKDLRKEFGFSLGPWNQGYMYDLLPIEYSDPSSMNPGDLVFVEGAYYNEKSLIFTLRYFILTFGRKAPKAQYYACGDLGG